MKRVIQAIFLWLGILTSCWTLMSCSESALPENVPIKVCLTRAEVQTADADKPILLFWKKADYDNDAIGTTATPLIVSTELGNISEYASTPFNTGVDYPADNTSVVGFGVYPATALNMSSPYATGNLPVASIGTVDVLATSIPVTGNRKTPFSTPMEFRHLTTRITVKAIRSENTVGKMFVRNLKLLIPGTYLCSGLQWDSTDKQYKAVAKETATNKTLTCNEILQSGGNANAASVGTLYFVLNGTDDLKKFTLTAETASTATFSDKKEVTFPFNLDELSIMNGNTTGGLKPGEAYTLLLKFDIDNFSVEAEEVDWEDGGKLSVPVIVEGT